ncbi:MAG: RNA 2',3'-cyclic phosphodiesterase [Alphaproteobacteria bacterium]|nr:RNA 2',3'-cyclic phosphodiesterase [Alphaproteobacteria bacterium]
MYRLFVGLALPDDVREQLARFNHGLPGARWVAPENTHLTLRFIGDVDRHAAADIDSTLQGVDTDSFDVWLSGLGVFGQGRKTRALYVRAEAPSGLTHLQGKVESAVVRAGQPPETRKFSPHVTVARFRSAHPDRIQAFVERNGLFRAGPIAVTRFVLFESHMGKGGSIYEELADYPLNLTHSTKDEAKRFESQRPEHAVRP